MADFMRIRIPVFFKAEVEDINVDLRCSKEGLTFFETLNEHGGAIVEDEEGYYFHFEETSFTCQTKEPLCINDKPYVIDLTKHILSAKKDSEALLELLLYVNTERDTPVITCTVEFTSKKPAQSIKKDIKFIHTSS